MDEPHYAKRKKQDTKRQILYNSIYMRYPEDANSDTESRMEVTRNWGEGKMRSYCLMVTDFLFRVMKRF